MPPNAKPIFTTTLNDPATTATTGNSSSVLTEFLDKQADTNGLSNISEQNEDWTDVKHSERKKRDRLLDDGVLISLMKKSVSQMVTGASWLPHKLLLHHLLPHPIKRQSQKG